MMMKVTDFDVAIVEGDTHLSQAILAEGRLDFTDVQLEAYRQYIPEGGVVCDVGACLGSHTAVYSKYVGSTGHVHAFEPSPIALACLYYNTAKMTNVTVHGYALGHQRGTGGMATQANFGATQFFPDQGNIPMRTLDEVATDWTRLDYIKIDAEGCEPSILHGAWDTIMRLRPTMIIEVNANMLSCQGQHPVDIYRRLGDLNYWYERCQLNVDFSSPELDILCHPL